MPVRHNGALDPHQQTPTPVPHFLLPPWLLIQRPSSTHPLLLPRRLNTTRMKSETRIDIVPRMVIRASHKHRTYYSFAHLNAVICREGVQEIVYSTLAIARPGTKTSASPIVPVATAKLLPPGPPRVVGSKRKFVEDRGTRCDSIRQERYLNFRESSIYLSVSEALTWIPRSRSEKPKIEHGELFHSQETWRSQSHAPPRGRED